jgi:HAD superfamily hydrolase (TIGR01484 family)
MDGTLTRQGQFTPALLRSLTELAQANIAVVIVTGRSAGWVQGLVAYLPVAGAIAENGGVFIPKDTWHPVPLIDVGDVTSHRQQLAAIFTRIQTAFPQLQPSADNAFRLTDWTFDIGTLTPSELADIADLCQTAGWGFTYSTVQCHIRPLQQDKGVGLQQVLQRTFPAITPQQVITVGDSPNDEGLFDARLFPLSVGVANVRHYCDRLQHVPYFITQGEEFEGFQEVVERLLTAPMAI